MGLQGKTGSEILILKKLSIWQANFSLQAHMFSFCFLPIRKKYLQGNLSSIDPRSFQNNYSTNSQYPNKFLYSSKVIYILNSYFLILYMCFLKQYTYLFSVLAYCACVFPVIIHAGSLFFALKHVFSDLLYIPNYDF